ncbi:3-deoxy-7-phosphoheptulonate synthase [Salinisphaera sp.]|uniref:3-deoxy-7-phosphoheptulonate synthase n=1 Tax=Salinisphaera sp. TaxID=1914330 RepID=UPI000C6A3100|nr:3-deoxy-7-phosphoheptulonate synthase [Salinisphaera sp.]MBS62452.1 3-deoxy-7-phosphoheptulonate synthase [Salinisphaera sp.]
MTATATTLDPELNSASRARRTFGLSTPAALRQALPVSAKLAHEIQQHRDAIRAVLNGQDDRLLVITGPCSLHDPKAARDYGRRLAALADELGDRLLIVMRAYVEKPRTTVGWKGLLHDPHLDERNDLEAGLRISRRLLIELAELGLPIATEILSPAAANYLEDTLSWAAIGARTTESQTHRELVSGLDMPVGFKNGTDGELGAALDAIQAAARPHSHFGLDDSGQTALVATAGNPDTHLILRGGRQGPNYDAASVRVAARALADAGVDSRLIVDCSHANSGKDALRQPEVAEQVLAQRRKDSQAIAGLMLESHLETGKQSLGSELRYGVSVTDACLGWAPTAALLRRLARG